MKSIFKTTIPEGFHTVTPYLMSENVDELITFLKKALYAEELNRTLDEKGIIRNCTLRMGNTNFMLSQARGEFMGMRTTLYLYVDDADSVYKHAIKHGAKGVFPPMDMDYGDRQGGIIDVSGNYWWISNQIKSNA